MAQAAVALDREDFSCAICLDLLKEPVTLSCGHNYCLRCVQNHWEREEEKLTYSCPQCRHSSISRPVLIKNTMLVHLVEQIKKSGCKVPIEDSVGLGHVWCDLCMGTKSRAVKSCLQCLASYCKTHLEPHYQSAALRKHQLVAPSNKLQQNICPEHNEVKKMFCRNDKQLLCVVCCIDQHKGHNTVSAAAERAERQTALDTRLDLIQTKIKDNQAELEKLHQQVLSLRRSADDAVKISEETFTRLICEMRQRQCEVEQQIRDQQQLEEDKVQELLKQLHQDITELQRTQAQLDALALTADHNQFLLDYPDLTLSEIDIRTDPEPLGSFEMVNTALFTLSDLLQQTLKESLENIALIISQVQHLQPHPQRVWPQPQEVRPQPQGVPSQPKGVPAQPKGVPAQPQGVPAKPQGVPAKPQRVHPQPQGVPAKPQGVLPKPQRVHPQPQGVPAQPQGVLPQPQGVLPHPQGLWLHLQGVRPQPEGVWLQPEVLLTEPNLRNDFLKYSHEITLDPKTNHRQLYLSEGNRGATYHYAEYPVDNNPNRFNYYYQVLSRQGLTGRCYWEVKWPDYAITIAMAYKSIKRKGRSHECEFGCNDKSWALVCDRDEGFTFCFNQFEHHVPGPISSRIGVYLDYDAGILSFYSVTGSMNCLLTVQTTFTQPLHAGLEFGGSDFGCTAFFPKLK